jgi:hypothetical protein
MSTVGFFANKQPDLRLFNYFIVDFNYASVTAAAAAAAGITKEVAE